MLEIQQLCSISADSCLRGIFLSAYALGIFCASIYCIVRLYIYLRRISFETLPLTTCAIQSLLHFIDFMFVIDNRLQIIIVFMCLQTFIIIGHSLVHIYYKLTLTVKKFRTCLVYILIATLTVVAAVFILMLVCLVHISYQNCQLYFNIGMAAELIVMTSCVLVSIIFGNQIIKSLRKSKTDTSEQTIKQIGFVQISTSIFTILYLIMALLEIFEFNNIACNAGKERQYTVSMNFYLTFFSMIEMTPPLLVPIVFYYMPSIPKTPDDDFQLNDQMIEIQLDSEQEFTEYLTKNI